MKVNLFFNIKLNKKIFFNKFLPNFITGNVPEIKDQEIKNISYIKQGNIWKTTSFSRNILLNDWLNNYLKKEKKNIKILELGASSGISVFPGLKDKQKINKYYLTDLYLKYYYKQINSWTLLFVNESDKIPFMAFSKLFIFYSDKKSFNFLINFLSFIIRFSLSIIFKKNNKYLINLIDKKIIKDQKVFPLILKEYNIFNSWKNEKVDLILATNLLNHNSDIVSYFTKKEIEKIISNIFNSLNIKGIFIIAENKNYEKLSVFRKKSNKFKLIKNEGGFVDVHLDILNFNYSTSSIIQKN